MGEAKESGAGEGSGDALDDYELCDVDDTCDHAIPWEHRKQAVNENEENGRGTHKRRRRKARERGPKRIFNDTDCGACLLEISSQDDLFRLHCSHTFHLRCVANCIQYRAIPNKCPRCMSPFGNQEMREVQALAKKREELLRKRQETKS